jgi:DNA repair exonuclease SbcCD ATPase subunit
MRIKLKNVGVISDCDIEFVPGINLIVGSSGSGKSTLMRCIRNVAMNEFSDSDISFGKNSMHIEVENNNNRIEYARSIKANGTERCYYKVNGETYTKLGRQVLPAVKDSLRISDINVNGEDVNFNFNLQFSSPFLILGSPSTLYNVLTYRSSFDIASINDMYTADIKSNTVEISTNTSVKEKLEFNLKSLNDKSEKLQPIEQLYSDYVSYKHNINKLESLKELNDKLKLSDSLNELVNKNAELLTKVNSLLETISRVLELSNYLNIKKTDDDITDILNNYSEILEKYSVVESLYQKLIDVITLKNAVIKNNNVVDTLALISNCICSSSDLICKEQLLSDLLKQRGLFTKSKQCTSIINALNCDSNILIERISTLYDLNDLISSVSKINKSIKTVEEQTALLNKELSAFTVCPLCGVHLHDHK